MDSKKRLELLRGLEKLKAAPIKDENYLSPLNQEVMEVKGTKALPEPVTKIHGMTDKINTKQVAPLISGNEFTDKIARLRALKGLGKKALGILPFAGAGMAALQGNPAMAAEEAATDLAGPAGMAYEALKPESAGNPEEEKMMLAERQQLEKYRNSPAHQGFLQRNGGDMSKFSKLRKSIKRPEDIEAVTGMEHPEMQDRRAEAQAKEVELTRVADKIAALEAIGDTQSLAFWKKRQQELMGK